MPKADGTSTRFVQDASSFTFSLHSNPLHLLACPTLHRHIWRLVEALQALAAKHPNTTWVVGEADGRSYFYQWPVGPELGAAFLLDIQGDIYRMTVLSQGWTPSSTLAHTGSEFLSWAMERDSSNTLPFRVLPWVDNFHILYPLGRHADIVQVLQRSTQQYGVSYKPFDPSPTSFLNIELDIRNPLVPLFRVSRTWCHKQGHRLQKRLDQQHMTLRKTWMAILEH